MSTANNVQLKHKVCRATVLPESQLHPTGFLPLEQIRQVCVYMHMCKCMKEPKPLLGKEGSEFGSCILKDCPSYLAI